MASAIPAGSRPADTASSLGAEVAKRSSRGGCALLALTGITTLILGLFLITVFGISLTVIGVRAAEGTGGLIDLFSRDLPPPEEAIQAQGFKSTFIYDRNGEQLYEIIDPNGGRRVVIPLSEMPQHLIAATLATEDANFYQNPGFDLRSMIRALWQNFRGQAVISGASTITQQLVRNVLFDPEERYSPSMARKVKEIVLAYRLSQMYSKDEILERYLNEINYGNLAYGIEAAARTYFGKSAKDLNLAEASLLAGLPQSPSDYNPFVNFRAAKERQAEVLGLMVRQGYISEDVAEAALRQELHFASAQSNILAPHFVMYVRDMLEKRYGRQRLYTGGFRVYTTLDMNVQRAAESAVSEQIARLKDHNATDAAVVAINPNSGEILAMVGSADYFNNQIAGQVNMATAERQPGSTLKPFTYAAAFSQGNVGPGTIIQDESTQFRGAAGEPYVPKNPDGKFRGPVTVRYALANSLNIPALKMLNQVGVTPMIELARRMGITSLGDPKRYGLTVTIGGGEAKLLDIVYAYTPFANGGLQIGVPVANPKPNEREFEPAAILKIVDSDGRVLEEYSPRPGKRVISPQVAWLITDILSDDEARADTYGRNSPLALNRPAAAKTGTTDNFEDSWTIGYTPDLVVGVWVGNANNSPMRQVLGVSGAGAIWNMTMQRALKDVAPRPFVRPSGLVQVAIDPRTGLRPAPGGPSKMEWFLEQNVPTQWTQGQAVPVPTATPTLVPVKPPSNQPTATPQPPQPTPTPAPPSASQPAPPEPAQQAPPTPTLPPPQVNTNVVSVPSVIGMSEADAKRAISAAGLSNAATNFQTINDVTDKATFNRTAPGRVLSQLPAPGQSVAKGTTVFIAVRKS
ncbi:MAG TPA: PBP1A family penicillin-binding protein [Chloroflexota bacterium]|nr:PBP1A family penicillin-binding protein [Chloroflexota bacterium]